MTTTVADPVPAPGVASGDDDPSWRALASELDAWGTGSQTATFWWRDDDAAAVTPELTRLLTLSRTLGTPVALSVVPMAATAELAQHLRDWPTAAVLQHGYDHLNYAPAGAKKTELASGRPVATMLEDIEKGIARMRDLFGDRSLPVLVPPWNRIAPALAAALPKLGFVGLSAFRGRKVAPPGVIEVNTHIDIFNWRSRVFVGERAALEAVITHLRARRLGTEDPAEPTGVLTHHQVIDEPAWTFLERFLSVTGAHRAARWLDAQTVFKTNP